MNSTAQQALGRHIIAEMYDCNPELLNHVVGLEQVMVGAAQKANATVLNATFHHFAPVGVSGVVVIQESHLAIHTWPEHGFASVDLFTCGGSVNPWVALTFLKEKLQASHISAMEMQRGNIEMLGKPNRLSFAQPEEKERKPKGYEQKISRELWFTERTGEIALSVKHEGNMLFEGETVYQKIQVLETKAFGKMLVLNGIIATTEADEHIFHESLIHPAFKLNSQLENILVIGGGDGGSVRELLKYPQVKHIILAEIDSKIIEVAQNFFPSMSVGLDNPKVEVRVEDGYALLQTSESQSFDFILIDSIDVAQFEDSLMASKQISELKDKLSANGIALFQLGSPWLNPEGVKQNQDRLESIFGKKAVSVFEIHLPSYPTGTWCLALCQKKEI